MKIDTAKLKMMPPETLAAHGILEYSSDGKFVCPHCGNGHGSDGTGCDVNLVGDAYLMNCFRCNHGFDNIKIVREKFHCSFKEAVKILNNLGGDFKMSKTKKTADPLDAVQLIQQKIINDAKNLDNCPAFEGGKYRGISIDTYKKYSVGYNCKRSEDFWRISQLREDGYPRLIFPSNNNQSFLARFIGKVKPTNDKYFKDKPHKGTEGVFGFEKVMELAHATSLPIFVVEGEIDALSLIDNGFPAVATGGQPSGNVRGRKWEQFKSLPKGQKVIALPDNDPDTNTHNQILDNFNKFAVALCQRGVNATAVPNIDKYFGKIKDVNDLLIDTPQNFPIVIGQIITDCEEKFKSFVTPVQKLSEVEDAPKQIYSTDKWQGAPIDLKLPTGYAYSWDAVFDAKSKLVTSTPMLITKIYQTKTGAERELQLAALVNGNWINLRRPIPQTVIANPAKLANALAKEGISIVGGGRDKKLAEFLTDLLFTEGNLDIIPTCTLYNQPGWHDGKFIYPPGNGKDYIVRHKNVDYATLFAERGDVLDWKRAFVKVYRSGYAARLILGAALAAPALKILGLRNLQYHLNALSGQGKSALVKFAMSIYGDPNAGRLRQVFNATGNALDLIPAAFNDLPMWIDELQSAPKKLLENINNFVYNFEGGLTKAKLDKESEFKEQSAFRGVRLTTGEMPLLPDSTGQGAMRRLLDLNISHCLPQDLAVELHELCNNNFGHFGNVWTQYLQAHTEELKKNFAMLKFDYRAADYLMDDYHDSMAAAHSALVSFCNMLGIAETLDATGNCYDDVDQLVKILPSKDYSRNSSRALQYIDDMVNIFRANFIMEEIDGNISTFPSKPVREHWGYIYKDGSVAVFPTVLKNFLKEHGFPSTDPILKDLIDRGLVSSNGGIKGGHRYMRRVKINNSFVWVIFFSPDAFTPREEPSNQTKKSSDSAPNKKISTADDFIFHKDPEGAYYDSWIDTLPHEDVDLNLPF